MENLPKPCSVAAVRAFANKSKLRQKFSVKLSCDLNVFHSQIDMIKATRFHFMIFNWFAAQFNRSWIAKKAAADFESRPATVDCCPWTQAGDDKQTGNLFSDESLQDRFQLFDSSFAATSFRSVISAVSNAKCSGQFGSVGICGMTSAITFLAVSAFAIK